MPRSTRNQPSIRVPLPRLSDAAAVQVHRFLEDFMDEFEARYGVQIRRYYAERSLADRREPEP